jgi:hypothetical protein
MTPERKTHLITLAMAKVENWHGEDAKWAGYVLEFAEALYEEQAKVEKLRLAVEAFSKWNEAERTAGPFVSADFFARLALCNAAFDAGREALAALEATDE